MSEHNNHSPELEADESSYLEEELLFNYSTFPDADQEALKEENFLSNEKYKSKLRTSILDYIEQFTKLQYNWSNRIIYWLQSSIILLVVVLTVGGCYTMLCAANCTALDDNLCSFFKYLAMGLIVQIVGLGAIAAKYLFSNSNFEHAVNALKNSEDFINQK